MLIHLNVILLAAAVVAASADGTTTSKTHSLRKLHPREGSHPIQRTGVVGGGFQEGEVRSGGGGNHQERTKPRNKHRPSVTGKKSRVKPRDDMSYDQPKLSFSLNFDENTDELPCSTGCEGDFSEFEKFWEENEEKDLSYHAFFTVKGKYALVYGYINGKFTERIRELKRDHPQVHTLITYYMRGSFDDDDMTSAGILAYELKYNTCLPSGGDVYSGGTDFFVSGYNRYATKGANIGIHSWSDGDTEAKDLPRDHPAHKMYLDHYNKVCVPESFYWKTLEYDYDSEHSITENEIVNDFPWFRDCDNSCDLSADGGGQPGGSQPASCADFPNWKDADGDTCDQWRSEGWCADEADDPSLTGTSGLMANLACCNCGVCKDFADWKDSDGDTCDQWRSGGWCAEEGNDPSLTGTGGLTANQACCDCEVA